MRYLRTLAVALLVSSPVMAQDQRSFTDPYQIVAECLSRVCVGSDCLKDGIHFRRTPGAPAKAGPNDFGGQFDLRSGLRSHPVWSPKVGEIDACLSSVGAKR